MARSGDGHYFHIEPPQQLADIFQSELGELMATVGHAVRLHLELRSGVTLVDLLNDFERDADSSWPLPNLIAGMPLEVVFRLSVPPQTSAAELCRLHLT